MFPFEITKSNDFFSILSTFILYKYRRLATNSYQKGRTKKKFEHRMVSDCTISHENQQTALQVFRDTHEGCNFLI